MSIREYVKSRSTKDLVDEYIWLRNTMALNRSANPEDMDEALLEAIDREIRRRKNGYT